VAVLPLGLGEARGLIAALGRPPHDERARSGRPEGVLVTLVEEIRGRGLDADPALVEEAERRGRAQGIVAGLAGPASANLVDLVEIVDEALVACAVARRRAPGREPFELAADLLVLWELVPDEATASGALDGSGRGVVDRWQAENVPRPPERFTARATLAWLWQCRKLVVSGRERLGGGSAIPLVGSLVGARRERRERAEWRALVERRYGA
jgi:hypothetical protein